MQRRAKHTKLQVIRQMQGKRLSFRKSASCLFFFLTITYISRDWHREFISWTLAAFSLKVTSSSSSIFKTFAKGLHSFPHVISLSLHLQNCKFFISKFRAFFFKFAHHQKQRPIVGTHTHTSDFVVKRWQSRNLMQIMRRKTRSSSDIFCSY